MMDGQSEDSGHTMSGVAPAFRHTSEDRGAVRDVGDGLEFMDAANVCWLVRERACHGDPGARGAYCLIFSCETAVRRVWVYPRDWKSMNAASLAALCSSR